MNTENKKILSYGKYIITWISLILIVVLQVIISGITIGSNTQFFILFLSSIAAFTIISVYMNDRKNKLVTNILAGIIVFELLFVIFI